MTMFNKLTILAFCLTVIAANTSFAQSSSASQTVRIQVLPVIQIGNGNGLGLGLGNGNGNGLGLGLGKGNNGNHGNGNNGNGNGNQKQAGNNSLTINTPSQEFTVNSNKEFIISVKATDENEGDNILVALANNNTGGKANPSFTEYKAVSATSQDLLMNCAYGSEKSFSVNYKKTSKAKEQRVTKADLIYTATLP